MPASTALQAGSFPLVILAGGSVAGTRSLYSREDSFSSTSLLPDLPGIHSRHIS